MKASIALALTALLFASCGGPNGSVLAARVGLKMEEMMTVLASIEDVETAKTSKPQVDRITKELKVLTKDLDDLSTEERGKYDSILKGRLAEMERRMTPIMEQKKRDISPEVHREIELVMRGAVPLK